MSLWTYDPKTEWLCYAGIHLGCVEPENGPLVARACDCHDKLLAVCKAILHDATGDLGDPGKRLWPIRADNYRALAAAVKSAERKTT